jgi:esterase/lipase superfamily enzyme
MRRPRNDHHVRRDHIKLFSPAIGRDMDLLAYGRAGLPMLVFPSSNGSCNGYEDFGMVHALAPLIGAGRLRLYCVQSYDAESWYARHKPPRERAASHRRFEDWIINQVVPFIRADAADPKVRLTTTGCSFGAFHACNFTLKHPSHFKHAVCLSGVYDCRFLLDGHSDDDVYFNTPVCYVPNLHGTLLDQLRRDVFIALVCGQGNYEERCLASTRELWWLLEQKRIPNHMDLWGHDVAHDWPWWRKQIVHSMEALTEGRMPWQSMSLA